MISLVDTDRRKLTRRSVSLDSPCLDQNGNEVTKSTISPGSSTKSRTSIRRFFTSMRNKKSLDEGGEISSVNSSTNSNYSEDKTISSDALLNERCDSPLFSPDDAIRAPSSFSSNSSQEKRNGVEPPRTMVKKKKYFSERNKNIFKKLLHPSYQERNTQYRRLFGHLVEEDDLFLISFSCAYQREILCQGRMYISQRNICFHANILGWETLFALPFDSISNITKERAAKIFPNSIQLEQKSGAKYFFASFVNREKTATALNMVRERLADGLVLSPEEMWETMNTERDGKLSPNKRLSARSLPNATPMESSPPMTPLPSRPGSEYPATIEEVASHSSIEEPEDEVACPCESHFGKLLVDCVFPLSVSETRALLFTDSPWFEKFNHILKNTGYSASQWALDKEGLETRTCTYTMALNHAMAPKSCVVTEKQVINAFGRLGDGFVVQKETQNSGVPYSDHFTVQCSYCVTRVTASECRLRVHGGINYKKSIWSMVKGYIEKSTYQGLDDHYSALESALTEECERRQREREERQLENESLGSSVEDPTTNVPEPPTPAHPKKTTSAPAATTSHTYRRASFSQKDHSRHSVSHVAPGQPDYGQYIRVIIILLGGLLLLNLLLLVRVSYMEQTTAISELSQMIKRLGPSSDARPNENAMLQSLLGSVGELASELQRLKHQLEHKDEL